MGVGSNAGEPNHIRTPTIPPRATMADMGGKIGQSMDSGRIGGDTRIDMGMAAAAPDRKTDGLETLDEPVMTTVTVTCLLSSLSFSPPPPLPPAFHLPTCAR